MNKKLKNYTCYFLFGLGGYYLSKKVYKFFSNIDYTILNIGNHFTDSLNNINDKYILIFLILVYIKIGYFFYYKKYKFNQYKI